ncbi:MAG TPA: CPBP family glutamic-type intramembrane protease [Candidatus Krumholzibacteria bacterium]|nr:CPBP family glutamic-type intramembrane protease [Candidatus Krumholzibacteria bacterium]
MLFVRTLRNLPATVPLVAFCAAAVLLIPIGNFPAGLTVWGLSALLTALQPHPRVRRNLGVLLVCILVLGFAPIHTDLSTPHFITLGSIFLAVVLGPALFMRWRAPGEQTWGFWPRRFSWRDLIYTLVSIPLAWGVIEVYFFHLNPELPTHWLLPAVFDRTQVERLVAGINCVGIWDELFFINTVYALLRTIFPARIANPAQAVVYTSVLYDMAFTGHGAWIVYLFALTQGVMYEKSRRLLYVLIVHLIVDAFLVMAIVQHYYPAHSLTLF